MSMNEQNDQPAPAQKPAPKPKRKYHRRRVQKSRPAAAPAPAAREKPAYLDGLSGGECARGCNETGCVISGKNYCAHPHKGGLQGIDMGNPEAVRRLNDARLILGTAELEKKFKR